MNLANQPEPALRNDNKMKLGLFAMNCSGGTTFTAVPNGRIVPTWDQEVRLAQAADRAGWEFLLPLARWKGFGGATDHNGRQFEVFSWAAGITAVTHQIQVLATAHVPIFHPIVAAKQAATIDHIGGGRFGLNIVAGWNERELAMFGRSASGHGERYAIAEEWTTIIERLWTEDEFDFVGTYFECRSATMSPKPVRRPIIVQAGSSAAGMDFAARHADFGFQVFPEIGVLTEMNAELRRRAAAQKREIGVLSTAYVVCADTEAEAWRFHDYYVDELGDFEAAERLVEEMISGDSRSYPHDVFRQIVRGLVAGWSGFPLVGTPEQITDKLVQLHRAGTNGVALSWVDYESGLAQFNEQVVPLLIEAGLRER